jgi:hypothetical protein
VPSGLSGKKKYTGARYCLPARACVQEGLVPFTVYSLQTSSDCMRETKSSAITSLQSFLIYFFRCQLAAHSSKLRAKVSYLLQVFCKITSAFIQESSIQHRCSRSVHWACPSANTHSLRTGRVIAGRQSMHIFSLAAPPMLHQRRAPTACLQKLTAGKPLCRSRGYGLPFM